MTVTWEKLKLWYREKRRGPAWLPFEQKLCVFSLPISWLSHKFDQWGSFGYACGWHHPYICLFPLASLIIWLTCPCSHLSLIYDNFVASRYWSLEWTDQSIIWSTWGVSGQLSWLKVSGQLNLLKVLMASLHWQTRLFGLKKIYFGLNKFWVLSKIGQVLCSIKFLNSSLNKVFQTHDSIRPKFSLQVIISSLHDQSNPLVIWGCWSDG